MIDSGEISIVVQGDIRPNTLRVLALARRAFPRAQLILSTFEENSPPAQALIPLVDTLVLNADPGAQPPTIRSAVAQPNNINRQLVTTQAGLAAANRRYALKLRSDGELASRHLVDLWSGWAAIDGHEQRLLFAAHYTRHPGGINGYPFHVSDWLTFGRIEQVRAYWSARPFPLELATWFDHRGHRREATATARRFRALMTQEQWVCTHYAASLGYPTPLDLHDNIPGVTRSYRRFLARHCLIADVADIGLFVPNHANAAQSLFQRLDCVSYSDWERIYQDVYGGRQSFEPVRRLARWARRPILRGLLVRKWIACRLALPRTFARN